MIKHSMEWNEILGDAMEDVREDDNRASALEAMADEQELTSAELDDWYAQLIQQDESYQDHKKERIIEA